MKKLLYPKVLVTGAGGFIGQEVVRYLLTCGYHVKAFIHQPVSYFEPHPNLEIAIGDIAQLSDISSATKGVQACIHLAALKVDQADSYLVNVRGAKNLIHASLSHKLQLLINLSTLSTKLPVKGVYGTTKSEADQAFASSKLPTVTLLSSIVYGEPAQGVFKDLVNVSRLPVIPILGNGRQDVYPLSRTDIAVAIEKVLQLPATGNVTYDLGGKDGVTLREFLSLISHVYHKRLHPLFLEIPVGMGLILARVLEFLLPNAGINQSKVLGSTQPIEIDIKPFHQHFKFKPGSLQPNLKQECRRIHLGKREAAMYYLYVASHIGVKASPSEFQIKQLVQAFELVLGKEYRIATRLLSLPFLTGPLDTITKLVIPKCGLQKKIQITAALIETQPSSAKVLLQKNDSLRYLLRVGLTSACIFIIWFVCGGIILFLVKAEDTYA